VGPPQSARTDDDVVPTDPTLLSFRMSPVCRWNPGGRDSAVCTLLDAGPCGPRLLRGKVGAGRFWIKLRLEALETIMDIDASMILFHVVGYAASPSR
jgi:hypothetical protein